MSNNMAMGWGWILWFGFFFLIFSGVGNWGYTYQAHRKYGNWKPRKDSLDILNERYARGEITQEQYNRIKSDIAYHPVSDVRKTA